MNHPLNHHDDCSHKMLTHSKVNVKKCPEFKKKSTTALHEDDLSQSCFCLDDQITAGNISFLG